jgi:hypothetical protein
MPNIDPMKSAAADRAYVELGAQTLDDVARNYNGSSGKANRIKNARQFEELPPAPWNAAPAVDVEPEKEPEKEDDEDEEDEKTKAEIDQLKFNFYDMKNQVMRLADRPQPQPQNINIPAPEISIPVDIKIHVERDAEKVETQKNIKLVHDEKGHVVGASVVNVESGK